MKTSISTRLSLLALLLVCLTSRGMLAATVRSVLDCVSINEKLCENTKSCTDKVAAELNPSAIASCWYQHRSEVRAQLQTCLQSRGIIDAPCWKQNEPQHGNDANLPSQCRMQDPFEAAKDCWFSTCVKADQCSSSCDGAKNETAEMVMRDCIQANMSSLMGSLNHCVENATNHTMAQRLAPEGTPTRSGDTIGAVDKCITDSQQRCKDKNLCVDCIPSLPGVNKAAVANCWYDTEKNMSTQYRSCLETNKLVDLPCFPFDHAMVAHQQHHRRRRFADMNKADPFQGSATCWMNNCANLPHCSKGCSGSHPSSDVMQQLEKCYEQSYAQSMSSFFTCAKDFVPAGLFPSATAQGWKNPQCQQEKPIAAVTQKSSTVREVISCVQTAETSCKANGNCGCALPAALNPTGIAKCWYEHRDAVRTKFISCLDTSNHTLDVPCWPMSSLALMPRHRQRRDMGSPFDGAIDCWFSGCFPLDECSKSCPSGSGAAVNETIRSCYVSSEESTRPELMKCVAEAVPNPPHTPKQPDIIKVIEDKKSELKKMDLPPAVKEGLSGLMNMLRGSHH